MIEETINRIEARLQRAGALSDKQRRELKTLLRTLKSELTALSKTQSDHACSIAGYVDLSTHEATRKEKQPVLLRLATEGLSASVVGLELQYPRLTELVNSLSMLLSNMGI